MAARKWTDEQKRAQADKIARWACWKRSTGPRTMEGKVISSRNAFKHGVYSKTVILFNRLMRQHARLCATLRRLARSGLVSRNELLALYAGPGRERIENLMLQGKTEWNTS